MTRSGSEKRQRTVSLSVRLTPEEADLVRANASRAGVSVAGLMRYALLAQSPPRASRQPPLGRQDAARILGMLGRLAGALHEASRTAGARASHAEIEAAHRDLADMRAALFEALGRQP
jgi:Mobilization protein NikA